MATIYQEWANQNSQRRYPFSDLATLTDTGGNSLPVDFIVDALLYPLDLKGSVYLHSIAGATRAINFGDSATSAIVGTATWLEGASSALVLDNSGYSRIIGTLIFGAGLSGLSSNLTRTFTSDATPLVPSAFVALNQSGVRGIVMPDGTLVTGDIVITGTDGINVTTKLVNGVSVLRVDVVGVAAPGPEACGGIDPPICTITVERKPGSVFQVSAYDISTLALTLGLTSLDDICAAAKLRRQSAIQPRDKCPTIPVPPPDPAPGVDEVLVFPVCSGGTGTFIITAPSSGGHLNPIMVKAASNDAAAGVSSLAAMTDLDSDRLLDRFLVPALPAGTVTIEIQGIGKGQLP